MRDRFEKKLTELRDDILVMASMVDEELKLALKALEKLDTGLARRVFEADKEVNAARYAIEEKCYTLIGTQQPAAGDLRAIVTVLNIVVDLERMGDQAKGIAKVIPHIMKYADNAQPSELNQMGLRGGTMLRDSMTAYTKGDLELAHQTIDRDRQVDSLFARVYAEVMKRMAQAREPDKVEAIYEILRAARELERFADLATNIAERAIYRVTGDLHQLNGQASVAA